MADPKKYTSSGYRTTQSDVDDSTGSITWDVEYKPNYTLIYKTFREFSKEYQKFLKYKETSEDSEFKKIYNAFKLVWNAFRTHIRKEYPYEYNKLKNIDENRLREIIIDQLKETSSTWAGAGAGHFEPGEGANYATPNAFNPNKKAKGTQNNYYYKLGWKNVPVDKLHKASKAIEHKDLWSKKLEESETTDSYINSLNLTDPALTQFITTRVSDFDKIEDKINTLLPLLKEAKSKTMEYYKNSPDFNIQYGTDLAADYLDDIIKLFRDRK